MLHSLIVRLVIHASSIIEFASIEMAPKARIGDNVEIDANSCIDRGNWWDTTTGHNVVREECETMQAES
ncbi:probable UDP-3-O-acylglucosamine N-acyltransferase 2, mitochondrial [Tanacetum coccineum]|uniref:Probable UDP-3-O-acylglucosamine N-acyltransferase 2, mitochondrial n=1 Tax=Tanacetum coccineum TaxID=301880 RepID=A0ABQ5J6H4_9ASTR